MRWTFENGKQVDEEEQERIAKMLKRWRDASFESLKEYKLKERHSDQRDRFEGS